MYVGAGHVELEYSDRACTHLSEVWGLIDIGFGCAKGLYF